MRDLQYNRAVRNLLAEELQDFGCFALPGIQHFNAIILPTGTIHQLIQHRTGNKLMLRPLQHRFPLVIVII